MQEYHVGAILSALPTIAGTTLTYIGFGIALYTYRFAVDLVTLLWLTISILSLQMVGLSRF
jgi:uncharacterized protein YqgC (DUF456 family)